MKFFVENGWWLSGSSKGAANYQITYFLKNNSVYESFFFNFFIFSYFRNKLEVLNTRKLILPKIKNTVRNTKN